ncbi:MAG TPA: lyase family protein [Solirubrobacteraceae bacterium]|nr:lyase family protein [Solirubrobacteraceae bacterium]
MAAIVDGRSWWQALLDVEAALARACAREGEIPPDAAAAIVGACRVERFDLDRLGREAAASASPVVPLAAALREASNEHAHHGATSQDILDTAMMLLARRALVAIGADAAGAADAAAALAERHRDTPIMARTVLQPALPTSFGLKAAGWLVGLEEAIAALVAVREEQLAVQMGGPVGHRGPGVAARVAADLELVVPVLPWAADRTRPAALAAALGLTAGALAKVARDVALLAQAEVGEAREGGEGGRSSAMAHKRNPAAAVSVLACAHRVPGLVATVLGGMAQEHERAAGLWQAEWGTISDALRLTGSAAAWTRELLARLEVDPERMRANLTGEPDLGAAGELVDRALLAHRAAAR